MDYAVLDYCKSDDIKRVRGKLNLTQREFAKLVNVSTPTIERWESSSEKITGPIVLLLNMLELNKDTLEYLKIPRKEYSLRMFYMYEDKICTLIDVDLKNQKIKIKNYVDNIMFRVFGVNENPSFNDYKEFLKSRCFPETRDKLKLILRDLDLPFYDPFLIIEKTQGKMAEDNFWIKLEK